MCVCVHMSVGVQVSRHTYRDQRTTFLVSSHILPCLRQNLSHFCWGWLACGLPENFVSTSHLLVGALGRTGERLAVKLIDI